MLVRIRGGSEAFLAFSDDPLPSGTTVLVVDIIRLNRGGGWSTSYLHLRFRAVSAGTRFP